MTEDILWKCGAKLFLGTDFYSYYELFEVIVGCHKDRGVDKECFTIYNGLKPFHRVYYLHQLQNTLALTGTELDVKF